MAGGHRRRTCGNGRAQEREAPPPADPAATARGSRPSGFSAGRIKEASLESSPETGLWSESPAPARRCQPCAAGMARAAALRRTVARQARRTARRHRRGRSTGGKQTMFDYIIIGGGSAGCVLAARLSEDPDVTVALLEAGPADSSVLIHCPAGVAAAGRKNGQANWDFETDAAARPQRPARLPAARQGAGRLEFGQRHDLHPRPSRRLRPLGRRRQSGLVLSTMCCPISSAPRTTSAAPTPGTASAARST